tara:strand:- start:2997 stop:4298 length:1302 start_codon:yes stop_codon:yes gene_type:complete
MYSKSTEYQNDMKGHDNYSFIPEELKGNWVSVSQNGVNSRLPYWISEQKKLISCGKLPIDSNFTNMARFIHPTGKHICKMCNQECSIFYEYPTQNTWKWLSKSFNITKNEENKLYTIFQLYDTIKDTNKDDKFTKYFGKSNDELKQICHNDKYTGKKLSPGVMGNPPDRLDGFHCYNSICNCRKTKDKGRSDENMKSYTRDRRAYVMMSDGNVLLANKIMGDLNTRSDLCFMCNNTEKMTADHTGPISLGFIHDPLNFQACCSKCNSSKNNRLTQEDINKIKSKEEKGYTMTSWWAENCWSKVKSLDLKNIQKELDINAKKMLSIIEWFKENKPDVLREFITTHSILNFEQSYNIKELHILDNGAITYDYTVSTSSKKTKTKQKHRTIEILLEKDDKVNRKVKMNLSEEEIRYLSECDITNFKSKICKVLEGI